VDFIYFFGRDGTTVVIEKQARLEYQKQQHVKFKSHLTWLVWGFEEEGPAKGT